MRDSRIVGSLLLVNARSNDCCLLAVLKAGAAYVPLDRRIRKPDEICLEDAGEGYRNAQFLVPSFTQQNLLGVLLQRMDQRQRRFWKRREPAAAAEPTTSRM